MKSLISLGVVGLVGCNSLGATQPQQATQLNVETPLSRRADIDAKQAAVAGLLREVGCEGLLVLEPPNFAWLTSGAVARCRVCMNVVLVLVSIRGTTHVDAGGIEVREG